MVDFVIPLRHEDAPADIKEALDNPRKALVTAIISDEGVAHSYSVSVIIPKDNSVDIHDGQLAVAVGYLFGQLLMSAPSALHTIGLLQAFNGAVGEILGNEHEVL